jgi:hypothetical protein
VPSLDTWRFKAFVFELVFSFEFTHSDDSLKIHRENNLFVEAIVDRNFEKGNQEWVDASHWDRIIYFVRPLPRVPHCVGLYIDTIRTDPGSMRSPVTLPQLAANSDE